MNRAPAFQFYAADYLVDEAVQLMSLEEEGIYIRLLAFCWREGSIPADPMLLARMCKGGSTTAIEVVLKCFKQHATEADRLVHHRLELERKKQLEWREKSAKGGRKSGKSRSKTKKAKADEPPLNDPLKGGATLQSSSSFVSSSSSSLSEKKEERPVKKQRDERVDHPAIVAFREVKGTYPNKDVWDLVIKTVGDAPDIPRMRECWVAWRAKDYKPNNLAWLVDWYVNGIQAHGRNGTGKPSNVDIGMATLSRKQEQEARGNRDA